MNNNYVLIGFMGSGKTSFGKWLCKKTGRKFIDTDEEIVREQQRSINDIFATDGEEYFRKLETELLKELIFSENCVISMGGGTPVSENNRPLLKELGQVIYLRTSVDTLCERLKKDTTRPLLAGGDIREKITGLMGKRESIYEARADLIIDTDKKKFEEMYEEIKNAYSCN